ncbi:hypothetical protein B0T14DRAFT_209485 [Immersiella caudata]|uniref:Uncharacterized protein n=1 Tax=Immersiella caudata TaxID=314043 RepID=A0AA39WQ22_9PEZI|nr:hypothetical protein B0T14DRAFT_209485 [Immersiella caudata]
MSPGSLEWPWLATDWTLESTRRDAQGSERGRGLTTATSGCSCRCMPANCVFGPRTFCQVCAASSPGSSNRVALRRAWRLKPLKAGVRNAGLYVSYSRPPRWGVGCASASRLPGFGDVMLDVL